MSPEMMIYPAIAMFFLTFVVLGLTARARFAAVKNGDVHPAYFKEYNRGDLHGKVQVYSRHMQNHFEVPPIFYAVVLFTVAMNVSTWLSVILAWAFVALRVVHTVVHLGGNNVVLRFSTFGLSFLTLSGLWLHLFIQLLGGK